MNYAHTIKHLETCGLQYSLSTSEHARLSMYFELRRTWSETHNVAGPRSMGSPWELDFPDAAAALLDAGASAAATDDGGRTPQAYAQVNDEREVAAMLAEAAGG